uniref:2-carboxy-D-arabinitol-1-phosphatase n=1 Tax=Cannabis sativa TaxID=3483 RepID=A0A803PTD1_CANSA
MLIDDSFDVCFASPLERSKRTAEIIWDNREEEVITDMDLREIDLYSFQGLLKHEGKAKFGETFRQWQVDPANFNIDGHYPVRELWDRARNCWDKILEHEGRSVLVVAHNAVNQALVSTAIGLGTEYFRVLLQSNCGVSVLDFTPRIEGGSPFVCLDRLNQTPNSPVGGSSGGRKTSKRIILVCHGFTQNNAEASNPLSGDKSMNMLGVIQSQKIAELLLDTKVSSIISSPKKACVETANAISRVQEAADSLGADSAPRYVEMKQTENLDVENILQKSNKDTSVIPPFQLGWLSGFEDTVLSEVWEQSEEAWRYLLKELSSDDEADRVVVVVGDPSINIALMVHCLNLSKEWMGSFHLDSGSISIVDFPDGPAGKGVIRCINYTAHLGRWSIPITRTIENDEALKM